MMPLWRRIGVWLCLGGAVICVAAGLMALTSESTNGGELGGILSFAFFIFGLIGAGAFCVLALILRFFHLRNVRILGVALLVFAAVVIGRPLVAPYFEARAQERLDAPIRAQMDVVGERYLEALVRDQPDAVEARTLFEAFLRDMRAIEGNYRVLSARSRAFRAQWFLYYWTFHDAEFAGFTTYYPRYEDCAFFLDAFAGRYAAVAPVPVFEDLCTDRWTADGTERD